MALHFHGAVRRRSQSQALRWALMQHTKQTHSQKTNTNHHIFEGAAPLCLSIEQHRVIYIWLKQQSHEPSPRARALLFEMHIANSTYKVRLSLRVLGHANTNKTNPIQSAQSRHSPQTRPSQVSRVALRRHALPSSPPRPPRPPPMSAKLRCVSNSKHTNKVRCICSSLLAMHSNRCPSWQSIR